MRNLNKYARMCAEAYKEPEDSICGSKIIGMFNKNGIWACLTDDNILVIRGTDTKGLNWRMWLRNFWACDVDKADGYHDGWMQAAYKILSWFRSNFGYIDISNILGHSAGGSIAGSLSRFGISETIYTFGAPEYANKHADIRNQKIINILTEHDFTRKTVLRKFGYKRLGTSLILTHKKCLRIPILRGILDHRPSVYVKLTEGM